MRWLPAVLLTLCSACSSTRAEYSVDRSTHVERVIQDVTAMLEGMAEAHVADRVVTRAPDFRSTRPAGIN